MPDSREGSKTSQRPRPSTSLPVGIEANVLSKEEGRLFAFYLTMDLSEATSSLGKTSSTLIFLLLLILMPGLLLVECEIADY